MGVEQNQMREARAVVGAFVKKQRLPEAFARGFFDWYAGTVAHLANKARASNHAILVGVSGCQGSGKSTLARVMAEVAESAYGIPSMAMSLDDFYLSKAERRDLSERVHPLFATRGVPGTHDLPLLRDTLHQLATGRDRVSVPVFDKARDDRTSMVHWRQISAPMRLIFLEGWCVGLPPQAESELTKPVNDMEAQKDDEQIWRREVNRQLAEDYQQLFGEIDALLFLKAPSFSAVFDWRWEQEQRLSQGHGAARVSPAEVTMSREEVASFVLHYQRLTEHALETLAHRSDLVWELDADRSVRRMQMMAVAA